jgi:hypothetical protein
MKVEPEKLCDRCGEPLGGKYFEACPVRRWDPKVGQFVAAPPLDLCLACHVVEFARPSP